MLRSRWERTLAALGVSVAQGEPVFAELLEAYRGPNRYYHNLDHLEAVLATLETLAQPSQNLPALELAAWFHDVIYDSRAADNEERSAELAESVCARWGLPEETINTVSRLIRATKTHQAEADDIDAQLLLDADLSILGVGWASYYAYAAAIRKEYSWVPENDYRTGRSRVLKQFLERKRIYHCEAMHDNLDSSARENLRRELELLTGQ